MSYVVCEKCGGYYELEEGESPHDFDLCQCGGNLEYMDGIHQESEKEDKPKLLCSNCLEENFDGIYCSKCGGKLIAVKNGKAISNINFDESKELEKLSRNASKKDKKDVTVYKESADIFERINWLGVLAGVGFFIISVFLSAFILVFSSFSSSSYGYPDYSEFIFAFMALILLGLFLAIISGGLAAYISKSRDYVDGLINGFLVGLIFSVILGIFGGILSIFVGIVVYGALTAVGGAIGIFLRNKFVD
ncbi:MAG: hypothetical protein HZC47_06550 [Methanobacterium sp.]|uniref:hypothetical protein n=1 Tax=Methanobacterium sp. TaxID=2164 RepID=UPI003D659EEC|nr:hypothetical protein [Methanobacterium sp.]